MAFTKFVLTYLQLSALLFALDHFPENTPKRWEAIALYLDLACRTDQTEYCPEITLNEILLSSSVPSPKSRKVTFSGSPKQCKEIVIILRTFYLVLCESLKKLYAPFISTPDRISALKPLILTPSTSVCCDAHIQTRNRPSFPTVYTSTGTYVAASCHGQCSKCNTVYYPSHMEHLSNKTYLLCNVDSIKYLQISLQTAFEVEYLKHVTNQLAVCSSTFESIAELYSITNASRDRERLSCLMTFSRSSVVNPWQLNKQRLEEGWFLYRLATFYQSRGIYDINFYMASCNSRKDLEMMCMEAYFIIIKEVPS